MRWLEVAEVTILWGGCQEAPFRGFTLRWPGAAEEPTHLGRRRFLHDWSQFRWSAGLGAIAGREVICQCDGRHAAWGERKSPAVSREYWEYSS